MSLPTVSAARILAGQRQGAPGEGTQLAWERFGHTAISRTYNTDAQTPASAGTMTPMATGAKRRYGVLGGGYNGTASRRERGSQYVSNTVLPVELKQKQKKFTINPQ